MLVTSTEPDLWERLAQSERDLEAAKNVREEACATAIRAVQTRSSGNPLLDWALFHHGLVYRRALSDAAAIHQELVTHRGELVILEELATRASPEFEKKYMSGLIDPKELIPMTVSRTVILSMLGSEGLGVVRRKKDAQKDDLTLRVSTAGHVYEFSSVNSVVLPVDQAGLMIFSLHSITWWGFQCSLLRYNSIGSVNLALVIACWARAAQACSLVDKRSLGFSMCLRVLNCAMRKRLMKW